MSKFGSRTVSLRLCEQKVPPACHVPYFFPLWRKLIIDGHELTHKIRVLHGSRAAQLLNKDRRGFGATVKQLYLSGQAGGAELRELLAHNESMETDQPESNFGGPAASASGSATPTSGRGERDAAG